MLKFLKQSHFLLRVLLAGLLMSMTLSASAHFLLNLSVRVTHVEHTEDGLHVYMRMRMPYLVADKVGAQDGDTLPEAAPFTTSAMEDG